MRHTFVQPLFRLALLVVALVSSGCLQVEQTLTLHDDGTGTLEMAYGIPVDAVAQWQADFPDAAATGPAGSAVPAGFGIDAEDIKRDLAQYEPMGISVLEASTEVRDGHRWTRFRLGFEHLSGLARTSFYRWSWLELARSNKGLYVYRQHIDGSRGPGQGLLAAADPERAKRLHELVQGLRIQMVVRTPRDIVATNAPERRHREARWTVAPGPETPLEDLLKDRDLVVAFDGAGLDLPELRRQRITLPAPP